MDKLAGIDDAVHRYYSQKAVSEDLIEAILYSVNAGGKTASSAGTFGLIGRYGFGVDSKTF